MKLFICIKALTTDESLSSQMSPPLKVMWPGITVPSIKQIENDYGVARIAWDEPIVIGSAKLSHFRVVCECVNTGQVSSRGPLEPSILECEFHGLDSGKHKVFLEVHAYGLAEPFVSKPIYIDFGYKPEAPVLSASVLGFEKRIKLNTLAARLANKRDRLINIVTSFANTNSGSHSQLFSKSTLAKAMSTLRQADDALIDCLRLIANYTG
jgi:hypothetical protein